MKILYVTTVGGTMMFFKDLIGELLKDGHTVDIICNETATSKVPDCYAQWGCKIYRHSANRNPYSAGTLKAIKEIRRLVSENGYDIVHCHTPVAAMCTRLACKDLRRSGNVRVFYTAHGFHFYKGAPLKNWMIYYPIEKICSYLTDVLITINHEDYALSKKKMKAGKAEYVPGVGVDVKRFKNTVVNQAEKRESLGIPKEAFLLVSVGELNKNKNHEVVIRAIARLNDPGVHYVIAGKGPLMQYLQDLSRDIGVGSRVHLLGYRKDIAEIYHAADACAFPSVREGLGLAGIEGMACGLPIIASENRGTVEFVNANENGFLIRSDDVDGFAEAIASLKADAALYSRLSDKATTDIERFDVNRIIGIMKEIYEKYKSK